jgi:AcrR family transcriptional regulator
MSLIAKKANISKGLIYNYFESKDELMHEIVKSAYTFILHHFSLDSEKATFNNIIEFVEKTFEMIDENKEFWRIYFLVSMQEEVLPHVQKSIGDVMMPLTKELEKVFKKMKMPNPEAEAKFFDALLDGLTLNYILDSKKFNKEFILNRIKEIYKL